MLAYTLARPFIYLFFGLCICLTATNKLYNLIAVNDWAKIIIAITIVAILIASHVFKYNSLKLVLLGLVLFSTKQYIHLSQIHVADNSFDIIKLPNKTIEIETDHIINNFHNCIANLIINKKSVRCKLSLNDSSLNKPFLFGTKLICTLSIKRIESSGSRYFNTYSDYLLNNHIYYEGYIQNVNCIQFPKQFSLLNSAQTISNSIKYLIQKTCKNQEHSNLLLSLLIGEKTELSKEIKQAFISTGTAHILAVSGLHLGLVYYVLSLVCKPVRKLKLKNSKLLESALILFGIWTFAFITGLGTSIVRAAVMFSLIQFAACINRKTDAVNTLFACGFFMVAWNPCILSDIGFQLSFAAVLSIIWFNPFIKRIWIPNYKISFLLRDLISVSCAVQILITPLSLYYFQQFPLYFIFSNLIWIPLSSILMATGFLQGILFLFSYECALLIGTITETLMDYGMNALLHIQHAPHAVLSDLWINKMQLGLMLCSFAVLRFYFHNQQIDLLIKSLLLAVTSVITLYYIEFKNINSCDLILFKQKNTLQLEFRHGHHSYSSAPSSFLLTKYRSATKINRIDSTTTTEIIRLINQIQSKAQISLNHITKNCYLLSYNNDTLLLSTKQILKSEQACIAFYQECIHASINLQSNIPKIINIEK